MEVNSPVLDNAGVEDLAGVEDDDNAIDAHDPGVDHDDSDSSGEEILADPV